MTFDDGIVGIYSLTQTTEAGTKPKKGITLVASFYFGYDNLGFQRYYTALQANQQISAVINIPGWEELDPATTVAVMEDGKQYRVQLAQPQTDENGLRITKLSLERIHEDYDVLS